MINRSILIALTMVIGLVVTPTVQAVTCALAATGPAINTTVSLQGGAITVGQDVPNGTVIYRQYFKPSHGPLVDCQSNPTSWSWNLNSLYSMTPKPLSAWAGGMWAGKLYESGVPGIGVAAWYSGTVFPMRRDGNTVDAGASYHYGSNAQFDISFVKTGPISPGVIRGQDLPTVVSDFIINGGATLRTLSLNYSSTLNVVSQTCTTPNPLVQLGKHEVSTAFKGVGSVTDWKDASINLTNCPRFYGKMDSGQSNYGSDSPTDRGQAGTPQANTLGLILKPNTAILDANNGIIGLKAEANVATGVGIQLATSISGATGTMAQFNTEKSYAMSNSASTTYTIPLFARYIQTNAKVTPGPANATLTYTINYY